MSNFTKFDNTEYEGKNQNFKYLNRLIEVVFEII